MILDMILDDMDYRWDGNMYVCDLCIYIYIYQLDR